MSSDIDVISANPALYHCYGRRYRCTATASRWRSCCYSITCQQRRVVQRRTVRCSFGHGIRYAVQQSTEISSPAGLVRHGGQVGRQITYFARSFSVQIDNAVEGFRQQSHQGWGHISSGGRYQFDHCLSSSQGVRVAVDGSDDLGGQCEIVKTFIRKYNARSSFVAQSSCVEHTLGRGVRLSAIDDGGQEHITTYTVVGQLILPISKTFGIR